MKLLHFAFIGAFPGRYPQHRPQHRLNGGPNFVQTLPLNCDTMSVNVGGVKYSLFSDDVRKHPGSLFEKYLNNHHNDEPVTIYRDGTLFKFVNAFLVNGQLPKDSTGRGTLGRDMLNALKNEATFFGLTSLEEECGRTAGDVSLSLQDSPAAMVPAMLHTLQIAQRCGSAVRTLRQIWQPLALKGTLPRKIHTKGLIKKTTLESVDIEHLTLLAKKIPPKNTISNISAYLLSGYALQNIERHIDVSAMFPDIEKIDIRARKLSVRTEGEAQDHTIDITEEKDCLGFVEVLLNSSFTGGELCATQNGACTIVKTEPAHYVAMHADANWSISLVTSGTRVSLVFGMYGASPANFPTHSTGKVKNGYWGDLLESSELIRTFDPDEEIQHLIRTAKYLCPEQDTADAKNFEIDSLFLNEAGVYMTQSFKTLKPTLRSMFFHKELAFCAQKLQIRMGDSSSQEDEEVNSSVQDRKYGFLGTLVVLNEREFTGGTVRVTGADGVVSNLDVGPNYWYAVAAGGASTVAPVTSGNRLSLHYDIYDATPEHDPLTRFNTNHTTKATVIDASKYDDDSEDSDSLDDDSGYSSGCSTCGYGATGSKWANRDDSSELSDLSDDEQDEDAFDETALLTRVTASERVKSEALAAVQAELNTAGTDAVLICLQNVYPEHSFAPKGGDQALYQILTSQVGGMPLFDVQPVAVSLHTARDEAGHLKIVSGTHAPVSGGCPSSTRLIVPITLSNEHRSVSDTDTYKLSGLRVTKKKKN